MSDTLLTSREAAAIIGVPEWTLKSIRRTLPIGTKSHPNPKARGVYAGLLFDRTFAEAMALLVRRGFEFTTAARIATICEYDGTTITIRDIGADQ
jgi:hypothetical protein